MNAPLYGMPEPALADAYRETARSIRREQNRDAYIDTHYHATLTALAGNGKGTAFWSIRPVMPLYADLVAWVYETDDDPEKTLGDALAFPPLHGKALREKYALARAEAMADAEERAGRDWLEV